MNEQGNLQSGERFVHATAQVQKSTERNQM